MRKGTNNRADTQKRTALRRYCNRIKFERSH